MLLERSGRTVDHIAYERDRSTVSLMLRQSIRRLGHAQESSTVWDEAVRELHKRPVDLAWIDHNLGIWFHHYAAIDEVYILSPQDEPLYAMRGGRRVSPATYSEVASVTHPLVERLRRTLLLPSTKAGEVPMLSPMQADFAMAGGRPAIISVKPVVTDTGAISQAPGSEAVHIAVVFIDRNFFSTRGQLYGLSHASYGMRPSERSDSASIALISKSGRAVGYLVWRPFAPGFTAMSAIGPIILIAALLLMIAIYFLVQRLAKRTSDLEESRLQAQHQATHDALTGLANRAMFEVRLDEVLSRSRRDRTLVALLYIDLDRFKQVNDTLGHPAGDILIRQVARRLIDEVRDYDVVARLGGDEFAIIIADPLSVLAIDRICERIVAELERPFAVSGSQAYIGASIGVAMAPDDGVDRAELTRKADIALYKAKVNGRSRFVRFTPDLDDDVRTREANYRDLRQALADREHQFSVYYQPTFSIKTGRMTGVEALLRWEHPELGLVSPSHFIRSAEDSGLIEDLGAWVLRRVLRDARSWQDLRIAVNVSPVQLRSRTFLETVRQALDESGIPAERLELELTETALMSASDEVTQSLYDLRRLGVACALDDFGTGYSSLSHIRDLAVDRIKIDRSFVTAVNTVPGAALVEAIVTLAVANGLRLTAEGVETQEQYDFLSRAGCEEVQGFLLAHPMPAEKVTPLFEQMLRLPGHYRSAGIN